MAKVIFFIRPMHGHVNPTRGLVKELVQRGEEVIYYTTETFREKLLATGAECRFYADSARRLNWGAEPDLPPKAYKKGENNFERQVENVFNDLVLRMQDVQTQEHDLYDEIKARQPDYIIYDYIDCFWGKMLAKKLDVPAIANINTFAFCEKLVRENPLGCIEYILNISPQESLIKDGTIDPLDLTRFISRRIGTAYNLKNFNMLNYGNSELLNIVYTSRYFQPYGELFDQTFRFIGCSIDPCQDTGDFPLEKLDNKKVILISLGTNFNRRIDFYKKCIRAFGNSDKLVVMSVGTRVKPGEIGEIPDNFIIRPYVPQPEVLKRSGLFITHGGINSVTEGIYFNVPLMVFPQHGDQYAVGHQVRQLNAGVCFTQDHITPAELAKAAEEVVLNERFRQNCREIRESLVSAGGVKYAVDEIFKLKQKIHIH